MAPSKFIEIGFTALRDPVTGDFLPVVPLYIEATEDVKAAEAVMINDIGRVFAQKMKQYISADRLKNIPKDKKAGSKKVKAEQEVRIKRNGAV